ncbi:MULTISPECIES: hypothetical protein [Streptomyces]|uniref:hypothetical protein n=1 Tax=Streptomyces TaxID=1883 RepID=UPI000A3A8725|nr:hypothetical protein [Streptomyces murinus]MYR04539.1 hypothetical protein [Streptomyces sp. SID6139]MYR21234.1 hypothetical protein [Streptomyces sp. SID6137]
MSGALDVMQVAGSGATVLVAEMVKSGWESLREAMARLFRHGDEESAEAEAELRLLDAARRRLVDSPASERANVAQQLRQELLIQLAAFLQKHEDAAEQLQELVKRTDSQEKTSSATLVAENNTNSQVIISGGSINTAGGSFTYQAPGSPDRRS